MCVCVYTHTGTQTEQMGYLDVSPGSRDETPGGPEESDELNLGIHLFVYVSKVHMCMYIC